MTAGDARPRKATNGRSPTCITRQKVLPELVCLRIVGTMPACRIEVAVFFAFCSTLKMPIWI